MNPRAAHHSYALLCCTRRFTLTPALRTAAQQCNRALAASTLWAERVPPMLRPRCCCRHRSRLCRHRNRNRRRRHPRARAGPSSAAAHRLTRVRQRRRRRATSGLERRHLLQWRASPLPRRPHRISSRLHSRLGHRFKRRRATGLTRRLTACRAGSTPEASPSPQRHYLLKTYTPSLPRHQLPARRSPHRVLLLQRVPSQLVWRIRAR